MWLDAPNMYHISLWQVNGKICTRASIAHERDVISMAQTQLECTIITLMTWCKVQ